MNARMHWMVAFASLAACCWQTPTAVGQFPSLGPTQATAQAVATPWPDRPPARIYVMPFAIEPGLQEQIQQHEQSGIIPMGPVRQALAARPRAVDLVTGFDRSAPVGVTAAKMLADELARAGLPAVLWPEASAPPPDGWRINGQVVSLSEGSAAARNVVGFGVGNKTIGVDVMVSDPATAGGQPFFVLDSSDRGRMIPGTVAISAVAGFNPAVIVGRAVVSQSGISDVTQQQRLAKEVSDALLAAFETRGHAPARTAP